MSRARGPHRAWQYGGGAVGYPLQPVYNPCWPMHRRAWGRLRLAWYRRRVYPDQLHWWIRLAAWIAVSAPLALIRLWLPAAGPFLFEAGWLVLERWRARSLRRRSGPPDRPWPDESGDREPRVPSPLADSGAVALPEPFEQVG